MRNFIFPDTRSNTVAIIMKHLAETMVSRFTDFLTTDGEKKWRDRDQEFVDESKSVRNFLNCGINGWKLLLITISDLKSDDLLKIVNYSR
jgi:hypothetical protein